MLSQVETKPESAPTPSMNNPYQGSSFEKKEDLDLNLEMPDLNKLMEEHEQVVRDSNKQNVSPVDFIVQAGVVHKS